MKHKNSKLSLLIHTKLGPHLLDILLELLDGVLERGPRVVHLVHDQDALPDQVLHGAQRREVEPLGARDLVADLLDDLVGRVGELLVQGQTDGLDRDVWAAGLLEEGAEDAGGDVAASADGDHEVRLELGEDGDGGLLAEFVYLLGEGMLVMVWGSVVDWEHKVGGRVKERVD